VSAFDESWLVAYRARMAGMQGEPTKPAPLLIEFSIPVATKLPNRTQGQHWSAGVAYRKALLPLVAEAVKPWVGHAPMEKARVTITRRSVGVPDQDGCWASAKPLIDLLLARTKIHPHSLGLIVDDAPGQIELTVLSERVRHRDQHETIVRIERLG
jgi:hypothetical protein